MKHIKHLFLITAFLYVGVLQAQTTDLLYHLGSSGSSINIASVATDANGNIFVCGSAIGSNIEFNPLGTSSLKNAGTGGSGFIAKYNAIGILQTVIIFGANVNNKGVKVFVDPTKQNVYLLANIYGNGIKLDPLATGFGSNGLAGSMAIAKYDNALVFKSQKIFNNGIGNTGDILNDMAFFGADLYVTGTLFSSNVEFNPGGTSKKLSSSAVSDIIVAKYDTATLTLANNTWAFSFGSTDVIDGADGGAGIDLDNTGNIYLTGYFTGQNTDIDPVGSKTVSEAGEGVVKLGDAFVAKYNSVMACQWAFNIGAAATDKGSSILVDKTNGNVYVGGYVKNDALDVYFDPTTTSSASFAGVGLNDIFVASYTSAGVYNWHLATGSTGEDALTSLAFDLGGNIVLSGFVSGNVNFGNSKTISGYGGKDAFFTVVSGTSGLTTAAYNLGGASDEQANGVTVASSGKILVVGSFNGTGDYDISATTLTSPSGSQDGFITRHVLCTPPSITAQPTSTTKCEGVSASFTVTAPGATSYLWKKGTTPISSATNATYSIPAVTIGQAGNYTVEVTNSCQTISSNSVTLTVNPKPTITSATVASVCSGVALNYGIVSDVPSSYSWTRAAVSGIAPSTGTGSTTTITEILTNSTNAPIDVVYIITPTATTGGCLGTLFTLTVTVNPKPVILSASTASVCSGTALNYVITSNVASSYSWTRALKAGITPNTGTGSITPITETLTNSTTAPITVDYIITPTATAGGCVGTAFTLTVTVNPLPSIIGTPTVCVDATTQLIGSGTANATTPWISSAPTIATVNNAGLVKGITAGTSIITYKNSNGCIVPQMVTVNAAPTITGVITVCDNSTTQLTGSGTANGTTPWVSATPSVATVNGSGLVTGIAAGTSIITYTNNVGCTETTTITVNLLPTITGTLSVCEGSTTQLTGSGTANVTTPWVSATPAVATVSNSGLVTGVAAGTSVITYKNSNGCTITALVTVNDKPAITGILQVCDNSTTQLTGSNTPASSNPWVSASASIATISNTGLVTGVSPGTSVVTYTDNAGCFITSTVTVNPLPTITGTSSVCVGLTTQLTGSGTAATSNAWVSGTPAVATVSTSGLVTGVAAGSSIITYKNSNGCTITQTVTVTAAPTIGGTLTVCVGLTTQLTGSGTAASSNAWVSGTPSVATVSNTGLVTALAAGSSIITYTNSNSCVATQTVTVNPLPAITGTPTLCVGSTTQLTGSGTAHATTPWVSGTPAVATVSNTGLVTGVSVGSSVITYRNSNGCVTTQTVTVTPSAPAGVTISASATNICAGASITLTANPANGGTPTYKWKLGSNYISLATNATYTTTTAANNDSYTVEMTSSLSCASPSVVTSNPAVITVNPVLVPVATISTASSTICLGDAITFNSTVTNPGTTPTYVWRKNGIAITPAATGNSYSTTGAANGDVYSVVVTSNALCASPTSDVSNGITVAVNALPTISGTSTVCAGLTTQLTGSGTANASSPWVSATPAVATVTNTGLVSGVSAGTSIITYTNSNGCSETITVTVNPAPVITGTFSVCIGSTTQLTGSNTPASSNPWISASPSKATIDNTGLVTGVTAGTSIITYTTSTGCSKTAFVTVNALPTITGIPTVCVGSTTQLTGSGTAQATSPWVSATPSVATVSSNGLVTGVAAGTSVITYMNSNGCLMTQTVTVNPIANPSVSITANNSNICAGANVIFTATPTNEGTSPTYKWKLGSGYISGATNDTYETTAATDGQSYSVEMASNAACASTSTVTSNAIVITVSASVIPTVSVSVDPGNSICAGTAVTFTALPSNGGTAPTYQWRKGVSIISNATNATYITSALVNGDQISVDVVSNSTCASTFNTSSTPITMVVTPIVTSTVSITASAATVCAGTAVTFNATYTGGGATPLFEWFINGVSQGSPSSLDTYSPILSNGDVVFVKMTSSLQCVTSSVITSNSKTTTVTANVIPAVSIISNKSTICAGGSVLFTATPANGGTASYQWKINGNNSGGATASNTFTTSSLVDGDIVSVVLTSSITCVSNTTALSTGLTISVAPETQIVSQPGNQSVCALGNNVTFSVGATGDNLTYQWKAGNTDLANNSTYSGVKTKDLIISNVSNADLLAYKVVITGTCGTLTSTVATLNQSTSSISITTQPVAQILEVGEVIQLSVTATGPTLAYQWKKNGVDLINDSRISGANTASLQISNALVSDSDNNYTCLIMSPCAPQVSSNATSVTVTTATSTQDALAKGFVVAPNPSAGHFTLSNNYTPFIVEELEIISMEGVVVARKTIAGTTNLSEEVYAQDLPKGMYLLVIKGEGEQAVLKIVFDK